MMIKSLLLLMVSLGAGYLAVGTDLLNQGMCLVSG
ncbi:hypothetical protein FHR99_002103 [Litorivivens lipolytica]|uniref:Uncharacterized protein n=1 Tax=Litorivivens lipolytica TaxID=1524264 RepID=A0A7W4Z658_9GAMM|nr:hypothetical protein [Litorivivens lipolytica]